MCSNPLAEFEFSLSIRAFSLPLQLTFHVRGRSWETSSSDSTFPSPLYPPEEHPPSFLATRPTFMPSILSLPNTKRLDSGCDGHQEQAVWRMRNVMLSMPSSTRHWMILPNQTKCRVVSRKHLELGWSFS